MFSKLSNMLTQLESTKGSKAKGVLLKQYVEDADFLWMADMALSQGHSFGVKTFPEFVQTNKDLCEYGDDWIKTYLEAMKQTKGVTDKELAYLHTIACQSEGHYRVITRILRKDLRCGCGADSINRVKPGAVYKVPYQRCGDSAKLSTMTFPAILQRKANGMFSYGLPEGYFETRQGNKFSISDNLVTKQHNESPGLCDRVLIQELVVLDECNCVMDRATGNGIINAFIQGKGDLQYADRIRSFCWGHISNEEYAAHKGSQSYKDMFDQLVAWLPEVKPGVAIRAIETWIVKSMKEAQTKTNELIADGEEGAVLKSKSPDFIWQDEDPCNFQFKLKAEAEADFEIVDAYYGDPGKKYEHYLGGITVKTCDGLLLSDCGGGFPDSQRKLGVPYWKEQIGKIVTLKFNGITSKDGSTMKALDHPRIVSEIRLDKTVADTLEHCQKELLGGL